MSYVRQENIHEDSYKGSVHKVNKLSVHMPVLSPREKRSQHNIGEPDLSYLHKKSYLSQFSPSPKTGGLSAGLKLGYRGPANEERFHPSAKIPTDRIKSLSINAFEKIGIHGVSKFNMKTPRPANGEQKMGPDSAPAEEISSQKKATLQTNFENFVSRYSKLLSTLTLPNPQPPECSSKACGQIKAYGFCTNQGLVRNYNEDRVMISPNMIKPSNKYANERWPNCNIFGVFDGHGGSRCADFLKDNLQDYIVKSKYFPWDPEEALRDACEEADKEFLEIALAAAEESETKKHDRSGSCGIVMVVLDDKCYICNVGDSRAVLSRSLGASRFPLTRDHKPSDPLEKQRVLDAGGKIYQNFPMTSNGKRLDQDPSANPLNISVPFRISPGRLSISRAFGDIEAKLPKFGGNPDVLICQPEITTLTLDDDIDFIVMGSDGIYDVLSNEELIEIVWNAINTRKASNIHELMKIAAEDIIKETLLKKSLDNVTALVVCFNNLEFKLKPVEQPIIKPILQKDIRNLQKWDDYPGEYERAQTERRRQSKSLKRVGKGQSIVHLEDKIGFSVAEDPHTVKADISHKSFVGSPRLRFAKLAMDKKRMDYEIRPSVDFPKIIKLRTPR